MKASELFPGALVRVNRDGLCIKKGTIVEVRAVDADDKLIEKGLIGSTHCRPLDDDKFDGGIWCEYLDPLPLTAKILEKSGFAVTDRGAYWEDMEEGGYIYIDNTNSVTIEKDSFSILFNCTFVHQIQHALRLCGIEKEINI